MSAAVRAPPQVRFFRDASRNVHDQQVRVGRLLRDQPPGRLLVNDAGAIPYFADREAIDALGLGGFREMPFTRAALSGEGSTVELLQHLAPADRPRLLALYPNWFPGVASHFAHEIERVTIEHNVICGGPTKLVALADWRALDADVAPPRVLDELDVGDVESESAHGYEMPSPHGGYAVMDVREGAFDGGRIVPEGMSEAFRALVDAPRAALLVRSDGDVTARVVLGTTERALVASKQPGWTHAVTTDVVSVTRGERIVLRADHTLRDYHVWIVSRD